MMLPKLKDRKNKINFNVSIKTFFTIHIKHKITQTLMSCLLAKNQVPFEICAKMAFQIYFLK